MHTRLFRLFFIIITTCFVLVSCGSRDPETTNGKETPVGSTYAMWQLIKSGKMTEGEVIVATLQVLAGEKSAKEVFGDANVVMQEGTALFLLARSYLKSKKDPKVKKEIKRLLSILTTNVTVLRRPEKKTSLGYSGYDNTNSINQHSIFSSLIPTVQAADSVCRTAWNQGKFEDDYGRCWQEISWYMHGYEYLVYYPKNWQSGSKEYQHVEAAVEAIKKSVKKFRVFRTMYKVYFVFTLEQPKALIPENDDGEPTWLAMTEFQPVVNLGRGRSNPIPSCIVQSYIISKKGLETNTRKKYQQAIAHELWHCFQAWHLYPQFYKGHEGGLSAGWERATEWWVEGSAMYYSNLVYPKANLEHDFISSFDKESLKHSILQFKHPYNTFGFFQFLANQPGIGSEGILRLLKSLPSEGGFKEQADALASFGDMKETFNKFGQDYLNGKIEDTGGGFIPFRPKFGDKIRINKPGKYRFKAEQFRLERRQLIFNSGWQFKLKTNSGGAPGKDNSKEPTEEKWSHLPESITTGCSKRKYNLLLTSADESAFGQDYKFIIDVKSGIKTQTRRAKIDQCLVGTWEIKNPSHDDVVKSAISKTRMNMSFQSSGKQITHFSKGCKASMTLKDFKTKSNFSYPAMAYLNTTTTTNGTDTADYIAAGGVITFSNFKEGICARMDTKGRVRISRRKGWKNIHTTTTECGPYAKGKNAGKRQTTSRVGGKSYDVGKAQKAFDINKILKFREQQRKKMRDSGFDPNQFLRKYGRSPRSGGNRRYKLPDNIKIPSMGMPMGQAEKEDSLFMGKVAYQCSGNRLTMRAIEPTKSDKSWEFRRVKK